MEGTGEILRIENKPADGKRGVAGQHASGLITQEVMTDVPLPYRIGQYGGKQKVALTFDDGPDPQWTPKILDMLKQENVKATFFLIGLQAEKFSGAHQADLRRRPRDRQSHVHASGYQQHFASATCGWS